MVTAMASAAECRQHEKECRTAMAGASLSERLALNALAEFWSELAARTSEINREHQHLGHPSETKLASGAYFLR